MIPMTSAIILEENVHGPGTPLLVEELDDSDDFCYNPRRKRPWTGNTQEAPGSRNPAQEAPGEPEDAPGGQNPAREEQGTTTFSRDHRYF